MARRLRAAPGIALGIQQIELQLHRHHRVQPVGLQAVDHPRQHMPRIGRRGGHAALGVHAHLQLAGGLAAPSLQAEAAGHRIGPAIGIADLPDQAAVLDVVAVDGQRKDGARQRPTVLVNRKQLVAMQQFAARYAVGVDQEEFELLHLGVRGEEVMGFPDIGESHG